MSRQKPANLDVHLETGMLVSISPIGSEQDVASTITRVVEETIWLKLFQSPLSFKEGDPIQVKYLTESGIYSWNTAILKADKRGNRLMVSKPAERTTVQRRHFRRYRLKIPISFSLVHPVERRVVSRKVFSGQTQYLSVAGLQFETDVSLLVGDRLELRLHLPSSWEVAVTARAIRIQPIETEQERFNSIAVQFLGMKPEEQRRLLNFLSESAQ